MSHLMSDKELLRMEISVILIEVIENSPITTNQCKER